MTRQAGATVLRAVRTAARVESTDQELLARFAAGDEAAFAALVRRHSGLVLGVCRRVLPTVQDAEDACQATFLILARKAKVTRWQPSVANWLYTTARRVASRASRAASRRVRRESQASPKAAASPLDQMSGREAFAALDEELDRLPAIYREPLVLCYLQGLTRDEASARLRVPPATLKSQLDRGRKKLGDALTKRGVVLGAGLLAVAATSRAGASPPRLLESILAAAAGASPSPAVSALAQGVAVNHILTRAKVIAVALLGVAVIGFGIAAMPTAAEPQQRVQKPPAVPQDAGGERRGLTNGVERTIAGNVVGPDGKPVAAELILLEHEAAPKSLGKVNADGSFVVARPGGHGAQLVAISEGLGAGFAAIYPQTSGELTLRLAKDNPIRGRVVDTQGKPVAGAMVFPLTVEDYGQQGLSVFLNNWKTRDPQQSRLRGQYQLTLAPRSEVFLPDGRMVLAAKTGIDGSFELRGAGAERVVNLFARGPGIADTDILVVNRAGFDPAEANRAAADNYERLMPKVIRTGRSFRRLHSPEVTLVAEQEMPIRGVVKDRETGKPRAGLEVTFGRVSNMEMPDHVHTARTDADGKFTIRGSRKYSAYVLEVPGDAATGYLPAQAVTTDNAGYAPIDVEIPTVKGIILTGTLKDKSTGKPLPGVVTVDVMKDNPYLAKLPTMNRSRMGVQWCTTGDDGTYRAVVPPGPVIVMAALRVAQHEVMYQAARMDPKYPQYFYDKGGMQMYVTSSGGFSPIRGCWCKIIEAPEGEKTHTLDITFEPAKRNAVRVVDADGKPVSNCDATGIVSRDMYPVQQESLFVYGLEANQERLVVVCNQRTKQVGSAEIKESDADPVITLGPAGIVTGRALDKDGKPIMELNVYLRHTRREASGVFELLNMTKQVVTDAAGRFRIEGVVPGQEFRLAFAKGAKNLGTPDTAPRYTIAKNGESKDLGDVKIALSE
jgi:RNA polymerase sigma factor (sigma-70 family)